MPKICSDLQLDFDHQCHSQNREEMVDASQSSFNPEKDPMILGIANHKAAEHQTLKVKSGYHYKGAFSTYFPNVCLYEI